MGTERLLLPAQVARELEVEGVFDREPTCDAATVGQYADSHRKYVRCGIAGEHFPLAEFPMGAAAFCFGDHTACPIWRRHKDGDLTDHQDKLERRRQLRITARQIETGLRVDDLGLLPPDRPS